MRLSQKYRNRIITLLVFIVVLNFLPIKNFKSSFVEEKTNGSFDKVLGIEKPSSTAEFILEYIVITIIPSSTPIPTPTATPTITPTPTVTPKSIIRISSHELDQLFEKYSQEYGVDKNLLSKIARCESGFNSQSINGPYAGMFQFTASAWSKARTEMGLSANPELRMNAEESIKTAAYKISKYGTSSWPACSR